jgi:O-antigen ligase
MLIFMRNLLLTGDTIENRISYYLLLAFLVSLPFDRLYSELALICFLIHTLIYLRRGRLKAFSFRQALLPASIYMLTCIGTLYTAYRQQAFGEWERQLAILLFPLLLALTQLDLCRYRFRLLRGLAVSCLLAVIYLYAYALYVIGYNKLPFTDLFTTSFINHNFSEPIDMHATYLSLYISLSVSVFFLLLLQSGTKPVRWFYGSGLVIMIAGLIQLSSRAMLIALLINIVFVLPYCLMRARRRIIFMLVAGGLSVAMILLLIRTEVFRNRYTTELKNDLTQASINLNILEPRITRWGSAWELIRESPVIGHGSGSEIPLLKEKYFEHRYYNSYVNELNAHNQFLSMWIKTGIAGLLIFLLVLIVGFADALRHKDAVYTSFMVIITVVSFSENLLDGNKGIFFFAFGYALFYLMRKQRLSITQK